MRKDFVEILEDWFSQKTDDIHTCIPGKIVSYEGHATRKAKVKPLIKIKNSRGADIEIEEIDNVPVIFPSTKTFNMLFPLKKDDGVLLLFSEVALGNFLNNNGVQNSDDNLRFDLTNCIAIPGLWGFTNTPTKPDNDNDFFLKFQNAKIQIVDNTNDIIIKNNSGNLKLDTSGNFTMLEGTEPFLKGTEWQTNWTTFNASVQAVTPGSTAYNAAAITAIKQAFATFTAQLTNMLSTQIKGK